MERRVSKIDHDNYDLAYIRGILEGVKTVAIVGASANEVRPSFFVTKYMIDKGYTVYPLNPGMAGKEILGRPVYASLAAGGKKVDFANNTEPHRLVAAMRFAGVTDG